MEREENMDNTLFQQIFEDSFSHLGFRRYKKNYFYYSDEELIIVINKQKSYYNNSYYINFGFLTKKVHGDINNPKIQECDIINRFICKCQGTERGDFPLEMLEETELRECFEDNIARRILPVVNEGIEKYFELYPKAICTAKAILKDYLGLKES